MPEPETTEGRDRPTIPPLVDWMSRHGWKVLVALLLVELLFHAYAVGAQEPAAGVTGRPATVRVSVSVAMPQMAVVRQVVPLTVTDLPDGRHEVAFNVIVSANCRWSLSVRRRFPYWFSGLPPIEVRDSDGAWRRLDGAEDGVVVVPAHEPCRADGIPVLLRMESLDHVTALGRVQFEVAPIPE